jgi:hypothetical protein
MRFVPIRSDDQLDSGLSRWLERLTSHKHGNVAVVALENKLARMAWAVLARDQPYRPLVLASGTRSYEFSEA